MVPMPTTVKFGRKTSYSATKARECIVSSTTLGKRPRRTSFLKIIIWAMKAGNGSATFWSHGQIMTGRKNYDQNWTHCGMLYINHKIDDDVCWRHLQEIVQCVVIWRVDWKWELSRTSHEIKGGKKWGVKSYRFTQFTIFHEKWTHKVSFARLQNTVQIR